MKNKQTIFVKKNDLLQRGRICIFIFQLILEFLPRTPERIRDEIRLLGHHIGKGNSVSLLNQPFTSLCSIE